MEPDSMRDNIKNALRKNIIPGIFLWVIATGLLISYYLYPSSRPVFEVFGELKTRYGFLYSAVSTSVFGGIIPYSFLVLTRRVKGFKFSILLFYIIFWAIKGLEVDALYRFQSFLFGNEARLSVIVSKTAVDQFIYSALWAAPSITLGFMWMETGFRFKLFKNQLTKALWAKTMPTIIISNWIVWIPAVSIVYALPAALQIPVSNLVLCFWVLIVAVLSNANNDN